MLNKKNNMPKQNIAKQYIPKHYLMITLLIALWLAGGCTTLPTERTSFATPKPNTELKTDHNTDHNTDLNTDLNTELNTFDARELLQNAVKHASESEETQQFWFTGYIKNSVQHRTITSMYDGVAMRPEKAYTVNGRIAAQPYLYYKWEDKTYIKEGDIWYQPEELDAPPPFDPFGGFTDWLPLMENATLLPDESILSKLCQVIEIKINAKEWIENSNSPLFDDLRAQLPTQLSTDRTTTLNHLLENTIVKTTIWIGKTDQTIYQYRTWIVMPLPGSGYFDQETFFRIYRYGDPSIPSHFQSPDKVQKWVEIYKEMFRQKELEEQLNTDATNVEIKGNLGEETNQE